MKEYVPRSGELFVVSGPSGAGKGTICRRLMEDPEEDQLMLSVSATTRAPREGEVDGVNYYFLSREEFEKRIENEEFLEYAEVYGNLYGTPLQPVLDTLAQGKDVLLEIDTQGAAKVKGTYPEGIFLFILPPSMRVLRQRLEGRGTDTQEVIERRLANTRAEVEEIGMYDYYVLNDDLEEAVATAKSILRAERTRVEQYALDLIRKFEEEE